MNDITPVPWSNIPRVFIKKSRKLVVLAALAMPVSVVLALSVLTGCPAFVAAIPTIGEVVSDAAAILGMISQSVATYYRSNPNPTEQAKIEAGITRAQQALVLGEQTLTGVQNASAGQIAQAFAAFSAAYGDLMTLIAPLGIVPAQPISVVPVIGDGGVMVSAPPRLVVQTPTVVKLVRSTALPNVVPVAR
jgi:hypothetical protein